MPRAPPRPVRRGEGARAQLAGGLCDGRKRHRGHQARRPSGAGGAAPPGSGPGCAMRAMESFQSAAQAGAEGRKASSTGRSVTARGARHRRAPPASQLVQWHVDLTRLVLTSTASVVSRLTKIIATLGPAVLRGAIDELIAAGADVFRLNFSHGTHEQHGATSSPASASRGQRAGRHVAILQDLSGPKIRTGRSSSGRPLELAPGDAARDRHRATRRRPGRVSTTFAGLAASVRSAIGCCSTMGASSCGSSRRTARRSRRRSSPAVRSASTRASTCRASRCRPRRSPPKDIEDLRFGLAHGVDIVALSFVQTRRATAHARVIVADGDGRTSAHREDRASGRGRQPRRDSRRVPTA